ncbi:hypothetical protein T484DRAFT_1608045, partial [Baffinella frigidus]
TLHPTPYTLHPTPCTLHPTPHTLNPNPSTPAEPAALVIEKFDPRDALRARLYPRSPRRTTRR